MQYFNHLHFEGFRRLSNLQLELRPLCVLIGANASGKTSVLDAFSLLAQSAGGRLKKTLSDMGGIGANLTGGDARWMALKVSTETTDHQPIHYRLALAPRASGTKSLTKCFTFRALSRRLSSTSSPSTARSNT